MDCYRLIRARHRVFRFLFVTGCFGDELSRVRDDTERGCIHELSRVRKYASRGYRHELGRVRLPCIQ